MVTGLCAPSIVMVPPTCVLVAQVASAPQEYTRKVNVLPARLVERLRVFLMIKLQGRSGSVALASVARVRLTPPTLKVTVACATVVPVVGELMVTLHCPLASVPEAQPSLVIVAVAPLLLVSATTGSTPTAGPKPVTPSPGA